MYFTLYGVCVCVCVCVCNNDNDDNDDNNTKNNNNMNNNNMNNNNVNNNNASKNGCRRCARSRASASTPTTFSRAKNSSLRTQSSSSRRFIPLPRCSLFLFFIFISDLSRCPGALLACLFFF